MVRFAAALDKIGVGARPLEPVEKVAVEAPVQCLGIQRVQPGLQQAVEVVGLAVDVHPEQPLLERQLSQDVQVRPLGVGRINLTNQRNAAQHVPVRVSPVGPAVNEG